MKLELKHLAAYLPYGLRYETTNYSNQKIIAVLSTVTISIIQRNNFDVKPILRPLSDLTKEIQHNGKNFIPMDLLKEYSDHSIEFEKPNNILIRERYSFEQNVFGAPMAIIQDLFSWHFDVFGLIDAGLAIDINTIES